MFTKNLFKHLLLLVTVFLVLGSVSIAQQRTYYVDNQLGSNGYDGLAQTVTLPSTGPKATITNAIAAANDGDIILVKNTGVPYPENVTFTDGGVHKLLTIGSYSGMPVVNGVLTVNNTYPIVAQRALTVTGPLQFSNGLTLTFGNIVGAQNLTIGGTITRSDSASVDAQISLTGTVNYSYAVNSSYSLITGNELPASTSTTIGTFTTTVGTYRKVILDRAIKLSGAMTIVANSNLDLNGFTISTSGAITADSIINGSITATGSTARTFAAIVLPSITYSGTSTLTVNSGSTQSLSNTSSGTIAATLSGGSGATATTASVRGSVTNSGSGAITLDRSAAAVLYVSGDINLSGTGTISLLAVNANGYNIGGGVNLTSTVAMSTTAQITNSAVITFGAVPTTIAGAVSNGAILSGTIGTTSTTFTNTNLGNISFLGADVLYSLGSISNTSTTGAVVIATGNALTSSGNITLAYTGATLANTLTVGNVLNNATATVGTACGNVSIAAISATAASTVTLGAVTNTSTITSAASQSSPASNGNIDLTATGSAAITAATVSTSGGYGGDIQFGIGNVTITGLLSTARTNEGADIMFGAGTAATTFSAGSISCGGLSKITVTSVTTGTFTVSGAVTISGTGATADSALFATNMVSGNVSFGSLTVTKGAIKILGTGTFTSGTTTVSGGSAILPTGAASFGNLTLSAGTLDLSTGNPTTAVTVSNFSVTGGTLAFGTGARTVTVSGQTNTYGGASASATVTGAATTLVSGTPTSGQGQIVWTIGAANPIWPGPLTVNNTTLALIAPIATVFQGGNMGVNGLVYFQAGVVQLNGTKMYISSTTGTNDFQNVSSYQTINNGYISITGATAQVSGAGTFADFEVNNSTGPATVAAATGKFVGNFYLTSGSINGTNLIFNNQSPYPTIIRNAGSFSVAPNGFATTPVCRVNVTYIGTDKAAGNEIPVDSLYNLTVATTNGGNGAGSNVFGKGTASRGVVTITSGTIYGTLTVNSGQVLALANGANLTLKGAAVVNGDIVNLTAAAPLFTTNILILASKTGTAITGPGLLPPIVVVHQSVGNSINGARALVDAQLGGDWAIGGGNDVVTGLKSVANGTLTFGAIATDTAGLSASFAAVSDTGSNVGAIVTNGNGSNLVVAANLVVDQTLTHAKGLINIPANDTLIILGRGAVTHAITNGAAITGAGVLEFAPHFFGNTLNLLGGRDTIATNVFVKAGLGSLTTGTNGLAINGTLTTAGDPAANTGTNNLVIGTDTLIARGNVTMGASTAFSGAGALYLNAIAPPLVFTYSGTPTIAQLAIGNDVNLAGAGTSLTVSTTLKHTGGVLNFGTRNLTVSGTYARSGSASYQATTGYFIYSGTAFNQGTTAYTIPNLKIATTGAQAMASNTTGIITVSNNLDVAQTAKFTIKPSTAVLLNVAPAGTVTYWSGTVVGGTFDVTPNYQGTISLNLKAAGTLDSLIWPATAGLVTNLTVAPGAGTVVVPAFISTGAARTVVTSLTLSNGVLDLNNPLVLTYGSGITVNGNGGSITLDPVAGGMPAASISYGTTANVVYAGAAATGTELPATVNNFTITRLTDVVNSTLTLGSAVTVNGTLTIRNNFTTAGANSITANGNVAIALDSGFPLNSTMPVCTFGSALTFSGATGQTMTVPSTGATVTNMTVNLTGTTPVPVLNITGGSLIVSGTLTLNNGNVATDSAYTLQLGTGVTAGTLSRASGTVLNKMNMLVNTGAAGTVTFPVGTSTSYRPVTITHTLGTTAWSVVRVKVVDSAPVGTKGLPMTVGSVVVNTLSPLYWDIGYYNSTNNNLMVPNTYPSIVFGLSGITYTDPTNIKSMFRYTDPSNPWNAASTIVNIFTDLNGVTQLSINQSGVTAWASEPKLLMAIGYQGIVNVTVSGTVAYGSSAATPIGGATVTLTPTSGTALTTTSSATNGTFTIANVPAGTYTLTASKTGNWGGVNAADALLIANYVVGNSTLSGLPLVAADVNANGTVNAADALQILLRVVGNLTSFAGGDWVFSSTPVTVASVNLSGQNVTGLTTGDVNASYSPSSGTVFSKSAPISLNGKTDKFSLSASSAAAIGSVTMKINTPVKVASVSSKLPGLVSQITEEGVNIAWYSQDGKAVQFNPNDAIVTVTLAENTKDNSNVTLESDITDIAGASLNKEVAVAVTVLPTVFELTQNYPNPFNPSTQINYSMPQAGRATLIVYNMLGQEVAKLVNEQKEAGTYTVQWAPKNLASGVYIYRLHVQTEKDSFTSVKRLTLLK